MIVNMVNAITNGRRQTGRTTKMMQYVMHKVYHEPHRYFIVGTTMRQTKWLADHFMRLLPHELAYWEWDRSSMICRFGQGEVRFVTEQQIKNGDLCGIVDRLHGVMIEDHYTIECRIQEALRELDRWV